MALQFQEPYRTRPIRFLELWQAGEWRMKLYGISFGRDTVRPGLVPIAKELARGVLPAPSGGKTTYGVGFVGIHDGRGAVFIFVDWWANENELFHNVFLSEKQGMPVAADFRTSGADDAKACVWDLAVIHFEREAWLNAVLANSAGPDFDQYLQTRMSGEF